MTAAQHELLLIFITLPLHFIQVSGWRGLSKPFFSGPKLFFGSWNHLELEIWFGNWLQYQPFAGGKIISEDVTLNEVETTGITLQDSLLKVVSLYVCVRACACMLVHTSECACALPLHADEMVAPDFVLSLTHTYLHAKKHTNVWTVNKTQSREKRVKRGRKRQTD